MHEIIGDRIEKLTEVQALLEQELNLSVESTKTDLIETGILDSLLLVDLIMLIESKYGIAVDITQLEFTDFQSIESICEFIERKAVS